MKSLSKKNILIKDDFWPDILWLAEAYAKSKYSTRPFNDIEINFDTFNIASKLRDGLNEYAEQSALESILNKVQKEKLTDKEASFLRKTIIKAFKENSELKNKSDFLLIREA